MLDSVQKLTKENEILTDNNQVLQSELNKRNSDYELLAVQYNNLKDEHAAAISQHEQRVNAHTSELERLLECEKNLQDVRDK